MADLLLELFSEEIPARMQEDAVEHLRSALTKAIGIEIVPFPPIDFAGVTGASQTVDTHTHPTRQSFKTFVTPRRIAIIISSLPPVQADVITELKGPKIGAPEQAVQGFLKKSGLPLEQLQQKDGIYVAVIHQKGKPMAEVVKPIIEDILAKFPWPKSMRWGANEVTWVRPLHSILCLFDGKVVPVQFGPVKASNVTRGHRFLSKGDIVITSVNDYEAALQKAYVIPDREKRKTEIQTQANNAAAGKATLKKDDGLLDEVTGLVEWPVVLVGTIDDKFMDLPPEVLTTVMRKHQKYFALETGDSKLSPNFLITANMETDDKGKAIIAGNERVLRARFSDARFFWDQDRKKSLGDWAAGLKDVTFHAKLGSIADKVARIEKLAVQLAEPVKADKKLVQKAAQLCKADLVTGMVGEFAELQGIMGRYYAQGQGEDFLVADAIRDHYKPQGPNDTVPHTPVAICVALADKIDTLIGLFMAGEKPTGSKDPFALRRSALGVIRTILENNLRIPLANMMNAHAENIHILPDRPSPSKQQNSSMIVAVATFAAAGRALVNYHGKPVISQVKDLLEFFMDRLTVQMKDSGIRHDIIKAVANGGDDDLVRIVARAKAVQAFLDTPDGKNLLTAYKRAANIVSIEEKKDKVSYKADDLKSNILKDNEEKALAQLLEKSSAAIESLLQQEQFVSAMKALAELRAPVDLFFDKTMVNCEDKELRANRLRLLSRIRGSMDNIVNFALIEG